MRLWPSPRQASCDDGVKRLYGAAVTQARRPQFYLHHGVPDTPDGRFDMIALHVFLLLRRLRRDPGPTGEAAQRLFDLMFADMDENLREMGVGDLSVGRHVRKMAEALYGRIRAYDRGLDGDDAGLTDALRHNLYRKMEPRTSDVEALSRYVRNAVELLDGIDVGRLLQGRVDFGPVPKAAADKR